MSDSPAITVRVEPRFKKRLEALAIADGRSLSSYVKRILIAMSDQPPQYAFEPRPHNSKKSGPGVFMRVGDGMPGVIIPAAAAKSLGEKLIRDAEAAKDLPAD